MSFLHNPFRSFPKIRLTARERAEVRRTLVNLMQQYPLPESTLRPRMRLFLRPVAFTLALLLVITTAGVGITYAAERSLPGSPLYAIKINVNEKIQGTLASTPQEQAQWNIQRIERRLEEAEQLIASSRLDIQTSTSLADAVTKNRKSIGKQLNKALEEERILDAANLQANLRATLNAHATVINRMAVQDDNDEVKKPLARALLSQADVITYENDETGLNTTTFTILPTEPSDTRKKKKEAEKKLQQAKSQLSKVVAALDDETARDVNELLSKAGASQDQAANELTSGDNGNAFGLYQKVHRLAQEAHHLLDAREKLTHAKFKSEQSGNKKNDSNIATDTNATSTASQNTERSESNRQKQQEKTRAADEGNNGTSEKDR